jgi:diketogulonate reductase-like aldo/keto reductase
MISVDENFSIPKIGLSSFTYDNHQITTNVFVNYLKFYGKVIEISELFTNYHCLNQALKQLQLTRQDVYIIFKVWPQDQTPEELLQRLEHFLQVSKWEYFDVLLIHAPINLQYRYEQWKSLESIKERGFAKTIGTTNMSLNQLMTVMKNADLLPTVYQIEINPFLQQRDLSDYCDSSNIIMINPEPNCKGIQNKNQELISLAQSLGISVEEVSEIDFFWFSHLNLLFFSFSYYSAGPFPRVTLPSFLIIFIHCSFLESFRPCITTTIAITRLARLKSVVGKNHCPKRP